MKARKSLILFLVSCLTLLMVSTLGVAAADANTNKGMSTFTLVSLIILGVVVIAVTVFCIIRRHQVAESLRAYKSEMKKITWYPWKSVWRNTVLVVVVVLATAVVIGLLDLVFFYAQGIKLW